MGIIVTAILSFVLGAGLVIVLSTDVDGFEVLTDGSRAIFSFRDSDWDAVFGSISLRQMQSTLEMLQQQVNSTRDEFDAYKAQQAVCC